MLFKNHLFLSLVLTGISLIISNTAVANEPTSFTSLSECRNHYNTKVQSGNESTAASDPWCKARMSALDFCTETALLNAISINSYNATQIPDVRRSLQATCQTQLAAQATAGVSVASGGGAAGAAFNASGAPVPPTAPAQQNCTSVPISEQSACNIRLAQYQRDLQTYQSNLQAFNQRQAAAAQQAQQQRQQQQQQQGQMGMQATQMMLGALAPALDGRGDSGARTIVRETMPDGTVRETSYSTAGGGEGVTSAELARSNAELSRMSQQANIPQAGDGSLQSVASQAAKDVGAIDPKLTAPADQLASSTGTASDVAAPSVPDTAPAEQQRAQLTQIITAIEAKIPTIDAVYFVTTKADIIAITNAYKNFNQQKDTCVKRANTASKLCLEGTSPGIKAAKTLMDVSGPILAIIGSAQKACSSTRKVTNLAAIGLTAAKGACVASKVMCDSMCGKATAAIDTIRKKLPTLKTTFAGELGKANAACATAQLAGDTTCAGRISTSTTAVQTDITPQYSKIQLEETSLTAGRTPALVAKCSKMSREILGMATNIMGLAMAKMSAQKCEEQLASSAGASGPNATASTAEYCSAPETSQSQFCKCQANITAEGCSGSLAEGGMVGDANNQRGANLKAGQGPNGFAGGGARAGGGSDFNLRGGTGSDSAGAALPGLEAGGSVTGAAGTGSGGSVAGSAGSGSGGTAGAATTAGGKEGDKKWNFGSFAASGGGAAGRSGAAGGNGNLTSQQEEAIERKIASERYAAEITTSSGKSNFDKIKSVVRQISSTLDPNQ